MMVIVKPTLFERIKFKITHWWHRLPVTLHCCAYGHHWWKADDDAPISCWYCNKEKGG